MTSVPLTFSIVLPTYGRIRQLDTCLRSLSQLDYPRHAFEVIVVDDGSEQSPENVIQNYRDSIDIRLLLQEHAGPAQARNHGSDSARNQFVVFIDDDCVPLPDWLRKLSIRFKALPDHAIAGRILNGLPQNLYSTASQMLIDYLYSQFNPVTGSARFFTSSNVAFPADRFRKIGGFDPTFQKAAGEDRDLCDRWIQRGYDLTYAPEVTICHQHNLTFSKFCRQQFNYGFGAYHFRNLRAFRDQQPLHFEPPSFYLNLIRYPFLQQSKERLLLMLLMCVSQAATIAGFLWGKKCSGENWEKIKQHQISRG